MLYLLVDRGGDLVRPRAHGDRAAALRDRLQPRRGAPAGVTTDRLRFLSLDRVGAAWPASPGIVFASAIGSGSPTAGDPYLLAAYAAAFLGATQLRGGRFNAWGTVIAVLLLGTGTTGLALASTPQWSTSVFTGVVLIVALAVTSGRVARAAADAPARRRHRLTGPAGTTTHNHPNEERPMTSTTTTVVAGRAGRGRFRPARRLRPGARRLRQQRQRLVERQTARAASQAGVSAADKVAAQWAQRPTADPGHPADRQADPRAASGSTSSTAA